MPAPGSPHHEISESPIFGDPPECIAPINERVNSLECGLYKADQYVPRARPLSTSTSTSSSLFARSCSPPFPQSANHAAPPQNATTASGNDTQAITDRR